MLGMKEHFLPILERQNIEVFTPEVTQILSEDELIDLVPDFDGWIIGDDPATRKVFDAGKKGKLKAAVKWGVGVDNVDFAACKELGISVTNTPHMFGNEVADVALSYILGLARQTCAIDRGIRAGNWPKSRGISLSGKTVGIVGLGDIGYHTAKRVLAFGMKVVAWDPAKAESNLQGVEMQDWPVRVEDCDFIVFTCALNPQNRHMLNKEILGRCMRGVRIVNVARGPLIDEKALVGALKSGKVHSAALDVFEVEPLPRDSYLREHPLNILGSHNGSNTTEAVEKTNIRAIKLLTDFLAG